MMTTVAPVTLHTVRFPGESVDYRAARDALLQAEIELRQQIEAVAALRRQLPLGGLVKEDYIFEAGGETLADTQTRRQVRLSELFRPGLDSLIIYNFMYSAEMTAPCVMCTAMLDGLNGNAQHAGQQVNLAVVAKSPIQRIRDFARERGWHHLQLLSSAGNTYNRDYYGEDSNDGQQPTLNVFVRRDGQIYHFYNTELMFIPPAVGQDPRHVDSLWPLWNLLDMTPEGRKPDWYPALDYSQ